MVCRRIRMALDIISPYVWKVFEALLNTVNNQTYYLRYIIVKEMNIQFFPPIIDGLSIDICSCMILTLLREKIMDL